MKYLFLAYRDGKQWDALPSSEQDAFANACLANDEMLRKRGHLLAKADLQGSHNAIMVRVEKGNVSITDGPLNQAQEPCTGIFYIDARDLNHAIHVASLMPQAQVGAIEVRSMTEFDP